MQDNFDVIIVVVCLDTSLCSVTKLSGGDVPTLVRDLSEIRLCH